MFVSSAEKPSLCMWLPGSGLVARWARAFSKDASLPGSPRRGPWGNSAEISGEGHSWTRCPAHPGRHVAMGGSQDSAYLWEEGASQHSTRCTVIRKPLSARDLLRPTPPPAPGLSGEVCPLRFIRKDQAEPRTGKLLRMQARLQRKQVLQARRVWPPGQLPHQARLGAQKGQVMPVGVCPQATESPAPGHTHLVSCKGN